MSDWICRDPFSLVSFCSLFCSTIGLHEKVFHYGSVCVVSNHPLKFLCVFFFFKVNIGNVLCIMFTKVSIENWCLCVVNGTFIFETDDRVYCLLKETCPDGCLSTIDLVLNMGPVWPWILLRGLRGWLWIIPCPEICKVHPCDLYYSLASNPVILNQFHVFLLMHDIICWRLWRRSGDLQNSVNVSNQMPPKVGFSRWDTNWFLYSAIKSKAKLRKADTDLICYVVRLWQSWLSECSWTVQWN